MESRWQVPITDRDIGGLAAEIDNNGYAVIKNYISTGELSELQEFVRKAAAGARGQYIGFEKNSEALTGTLLAELPKWPPFVEMCHSLADRSLGYDGPPFDIYQMVRVVTGDTGQRVSGVFHYDSYVLTALLPITIPNDGSGKLLLMKPTRRIRSSYLTNLLDKAVVGSKFMQKQLHKLAKRQSQRIDRLSLQPGNLYFFWGYRSIHTNEMVDQSSLRATALFHYGDPHTGNKLRDRIRAFRGLKHY
jgi:hypothetical protein